MNHEERKGVEPSRFKRGLVFKTSWRPVAATLHLYLGIHLEAQARGVMGAAL